MVIDPIGAASPLRSYSQNGLRVIRMSPVVRAACSEDGVPVWPRGGLRISTTITPRPLNVFQSSEKAAP